MHKGLGGNKNEDDKEDNFRGSRSYSKSNESIARQPEAAGNIRTSLMLGLVFIETAIIYALIVAILIIFVL